MRTMYFILLMILLHACQLTIPYSGDIKYLEIDYTHRTPEKKVKFEALRQKFLEVWRDTSNCYIEKAACKKCPIPVQTAFPIEINITNILHTDNFDTLLVLVTWYSAEYTDSGKIWHERTIAQPMSIIVDSISNWKFVCNKPVRRITNSDAGGNQIEELEFHLKRLIIKAGYLKEDKTPDPAFWNRLFTDPDIWFKDDKSFLQKLIEKIPFPGNVEKD